MTPEAPKPAAKIEATTDAAVLAAHHRLNLRLLHRIPYHPEYIAPQEILRLVRLCYEYGVDFTVGLEPTGRTGEVVRPFQVPSPRGGVGPILRKCRVRCEVLLQDPRGTLVPDGEIVWANQLLGCLQVAIARRLQLTITGRA